MRLGLSQTLICIAVGLTASDCNAAGPCAVGKNCALNLCDVGGSCVTVTQLTAGSTFTCALLSDSSVACWGYNKNGQLATGAVADQHKPVVTMLTGVTQIAAGQNHACAVMQDQTVKCWGSNSFGQLGLGTKDQTAHSTPQPVPGLSGVVSVALGDSHSCAVLTGGQAKCWGWNMYGQIGDGTSGTDRTSPVSVCAPETTATPCAAATTIAEMAPASIHTCARLTGGGVACWGSNISGQMGFAADPKAPFPFAKTVASVANVAQVSSGAGTTCARMTDGSVNCWGNNSQLQLGGGTAKQPTDSSRTTVCSKPDCSTTLANTSHVGVGATAACAVTSGAVSCWGLNKFGQLGDGTNTDSPAAATTALASGAAHVVAGNQHACARLTDGTVRCWGSNSNGQLGDNTVSDRKAPLPPLW